MNTVTTEIIRVLTVGGTIDKIYFDAKSDYEVGPPNIAEMLDSLCLNPQFQVTSLMQKDSLDMTDEDRQLILQAVSEAEESRILITHGTDTMVQTAGVLSAVNDKTIVLTGALSPALFRNSDAMFNIGSAITAVQILPPGVYITMNGQVFDTTRSAKMQKRADSCHTSLLLRQGNHYEKNNYPDRLNWHCDCLARRLRRSGAASTGTKFRGSTATAIDRSPARRCDRDTSWYP